MKPKRQFNFLLISLVVLLLDQASKIIVRHYMDLHQEIRLLGDLFSLTYIENPGAAFGFSPGSAEFNRIFFSVASFCIFFIILIMLRQSKHFIEKLAYSLVIGGAIGNLIDRVFLGAVTDFIDFDFFYPFGFIQGRYPVFNIADSAIVVAVTLLLYYVIFMAHKEEIKEKKTEQKAELQEKKDE